MGTNISPQALAVEAAIDLAQILDWFERNDQTDAMEMVRESSPESFGQIQEDLANIAKAFNFTGPCAELQGGIKNIIRSGGPGGGGGGAHGDPHRGRAAPHGWQVGRPSDGADSPT